MKIIIKAGKEKFQSTLPLRGATMKFQKFSRKQMISIHAPPAGSDRAEAEKKATMLISIHAPPAGSDARVCC